MTPVADTVVDHRPTRVPGRPAWRIGPVSAVRRPRPVAVALLLLALALFLLALEVARGAYPLPLLDVVATLLGGGDARERLVVIELRLPRALTGLFVGLALGASGAILQSIARNPLASPDVLGITQGATAAAVAVIVLGLSWSIPVAALVGGLATSLLVVLFGARGGVQGLRIVLVGVALAAALRAVTDLLLVRGDIDQVARATVWLTGSLNGRDWSHVGGVGIAVAVLGVGIVALAPTLATLRLSDDCAGALGLRVGRARGTLLVLAVLLASAATASAGPVLFVALVAPQIAMRLTRSAGAPVIAGALTGAVLLLAADLVARTLLPVELPVGVVTAVLGAPYLLFLLVTRTRRAAT